jgi:hypothetical protein
MKTNTTASWTTSSTFTTVRANDSDLKLRGATNSPNFKKTTVSRGLAGATKDKETMTWEVGTMITTEAVEAVEVAEATEAGSIVDAVAPVVASGVTVVVATEAADTKTTVPVTSLTARRTMVLGGAVAATKTTTTGTGLSNRATSPPLTSSSEAEEAQEVVVVAMTTIDLPTSLRSRAIRVALAAISPSTSKSPSKTRLTDPAPSL